MARRKKAGGLGDWIDDLVEVAVDNVADRAREAFAARATQVRDLPGSQTFQCVGCNQAVMGSQVQFMRPVEGTCVCTTCFAFMFAAGVEKVRFLAKRAAAQAKEKADAAAQETSRARAVPPVAPPWEVLGVSQEATEDEIGKAYRKIVMEWHPDRLPLDRRPEGQTRIDEATKAKNAMLSVRRKPTDKI